MGVEKHMSDRRADYTIADCVTKYYEKRCTVVLDVSVAFVAGPQPDHSPLPPHWLQLIGRLAWPPPMRCVKFRRPISQSQSVCDSLDLLVVINIHYRCDRSVQTGRLNLAFVVRYCHRFIRRRFSCRQPTNANSQ